MANPQKENGYTAIANEILDRLVNMPLLGSEYRMLFCIIRKTYGYQKKVDVISLTQFERLTGLSRPTIVKTLKNLMIKKMIIKIWIPGEKEGWTFIKDHEKWAVNTHLLVKSKHEFGKPALTKTGKGGLTHKRKKENKRNVVAVSDKPFSLKEEIKKLEDDERRDLNIIALYLDHRKPDLQTYEQYQETLKRHLKAAKALKVFSNEQILKALDYAKKEYEDIYTLETLIKILTK